MSSTLLSWKYLKAYSTALYTLLFAIVSMNSPRMLIRGKKPKSTNYNEKKSIVNMIPLFVRLCL